MRSWPVPIQVTEDEKIFGGVMSFKQLGYLALFFCIGGAGAAIPLPLFVRIVVFLLMMCIGCVVAFGEWQNIKIDTLVKLWIRRQLRPKKLYLEGD